MARLTKRLLGLLAAAALGCVSGPRIEIRTGASQAFDVNERFAPANLGLLELENPGFESAELWNVQRAIEQAIGWRGLRTATEAEADYLVSCAFRKRLSWPQDNMADVVVEPWRPHESSPLEGHRVMGTRQGDARTRGSLDPGAPPPPPQPWIETFVELKLRSRRTGQIAWSAERRWGRNRQELPEDELRETLQVLLSQLRVPAAAPESPR
jgi:hypothetical protein